MRLFLDTANIEEIREINRWGVLSGVTTNPSLIFKEAMDPEQVWKEILAEVDGDVSLETTEPEAAAMYEEGRRLASFADNAVVKVPMTPAGLEAGKRVARRRDPINVTAGFSTAQGVPAAPDARGRVGPVWRRHRHDAVRGVLQAREAPAHRHGGREVPGRLG